MIAAATLRFIDPFGTGKIVLFQVTYDKDWHFQELPFFILIGVFGGLYGAYFTKLNMLWSKNVRAKTWMAKKVSDSRGEKTRQFGFFPYEC